MRTQVDVTSKSVRDLLERGEKHRLADVLGNLRPGDISSIMMELNEKEQSSVFSILVQHDRRLAAETLKVLGVEPGLDLLNQISSEEISKVLQELETDSATVFVSALPEENAQEVLEQMDVEESAEVQHLLQYKEDTAGRIMTPSVFALFEDLSVSEAIHTIQTAKELEVIFYLYVVDERNHLVGVVSVRELLIAPPSTPLKKIMTTDVISVATETDQEEVAREVALYDLLAIPVVDQENKLVGVVTVDDVIDVIKEEASEDIFYLAGVEGHDHLHTPPMTSVRRRLPWLVVNLGTAMLAATVVAYYEPTIAQFSFLAVFLPVVAGMGGNSGTQTLTVIVRGLALGEISWESGKSILSKEIVVGLNNGIITGILAGLVAYLWKGSYVLGMVLGGAMIINVALAGVVATLVPLILRRMNVDPAIASGIFVTTFTDAVGFLSFLGLATYFLQYLPAS
ncbi:MAG: magnesium transporter [Acidobacteria bacterium]|nr:MAG: magnesium transporter [Acidobacteriota bacterium]TDI15071.1 MAG: magnesium transporter [Acidobacteriota bacterium]